MTTPDQDELLDQLVAQYADRVANGRAGEMEDLLQQVAPEHRAALLRCLEMVELGSAPMVAPKPIVVGTVVGGCRVLGTLGRGGVATVHRAEQIALHREVALKVLRPGLAVDPHQVERFRREGLAIARLEHPNIVKIHDVGSDAGHLYLVMEKVDGKDLSRALEQLPAAARRTGEDFERALRSDGARAPASFAPPAPEDDASPGSYERAVARFFAVVARAVAAAHAHGVIHRDLKPSNILLRRDGTPVVADFGLAKGDADLAASLTGGPIGTPHYMSPEQIEQLHARVDVRTDVYSLGVTLYEALAGQRPFRGETAMQLFDAIRYELPPPVRSLNPNVSSDAEAVVARAMARSPDERYATTEELAADLDRLAEGRRTTAVASHRTRSAVRVAVYRMKRGEPFEYKSARTLLGLPLVHIAFGRHVVGHKLRVHGVLIGVGYQRGRKLSHAKGWLAIGDIAQGVLAIGSIASGGIAIGALSYGVVSLGALALGGLAFGGLSAGVLASGGVALGLIAVGGVAIGVTAVGGFAAGHFAFGGKAVGDHVVTAARHDPEAVEYFKVHGRTLFELAGSWIRATLDDVFGK